MLNKSYSYLIDLKNSENSLETARILNVTFTFIAIVIGLLGNSLIIYVFWNKKFRTNSSNVFLLCLAISDNIFLIIHLFEDTLRTYKDIFITNKEKLDSLDNFIKLILIIDNYEIACRIVNYFRSLFRFISAYIVLAITLQRLSMIYSPLKFKSKRSAWLTVSTIVCISLLVNIWVPFFFGLRNQSTDKQYCDINPKFKKEYFDLTISYIVLILITILAILVSNSIVIYHLKISKKIDNKVKSSQNEIEMNSINNNKECDISEIMEDSTSKELYFLASNDKLKRISNLNNGSKKVTFSIIAISFSYAFLNLPYQVTWCVYFYAIAFKPDSQIVKIHLFTLLQIFEVIYILNYCVNFFIYCATSSIFRNQLNYKGYSFKINPNRKNTELFIEKI